MAVYGAILLISVFLFCAFCQLAETSTKENDSKISEGSNVAALKAKEPPKGSKRKFVVCYYATWAEGRPGIGRFLPETIDPNICTHILYAFARLDDQELIMIPNTPRIDIDRSFYEHTVNLKKNNSELKVLISIGGWGDSGGDKYSRMVSVPENRTKFATEAVAFINKYKFDGLDISWEFPVCWQADCSRGDPNDKDNFSHLVRELREVFDRESRSLVLSIAVSGSQDLATRAYDIPTLSKYVDFFNVLTYNKHGHWESQTGHVSEMYGHSINGDSSHSSVSTMEYYEQRAPPEKLMMGIMTYGRSFTLKDPYSNGIGAPISGPGHAGDKTQEEGLLAYFEICDLIKTSYWTVHREPAAGPYAYRGNQWVGYDDPEMAKEKALFILKKGYGGAVVCDISGDDFNGRCQKVTFPIIRELKMTLQGDTENKENSSSVISAVYKTLILWTVVFILLQELGDFF